MSGQDSSSGRLPSDYSSELHGAVPALVSSTGSMHTEDTPMTSSSSEPGGPAQASPGQDQPMAIVSQPFSLEVPNTVRPSEVPNTVRASGGADAELRRRLADHERGPQRDANRERSRELRDRDRPERHSIATPVHSRPSTPRRSSPRTAPVTPQTRDDRVSDLRGEVYELQRRLRLTEANALHNMDKLLRCRPRRGSPLYISKRR